MTNDERWALLRKLLGDVYDTNCAVGRILYIGRFAVHSHRAGHSGDGWCLAPAKGGEGPRFDEGPEYDPEKVAHRIKCLVMKEALTPQ